MMSMVAELNIKRLGRGVSSRHSRRLSGGCE